MIRLTAITEPAKRRLARLAEGLTATALDPIVDRVMLKGLAMMVRESPKKWFDQIRSGWEVTRPFLGMRVMDIPATKRTTSGTEIRQIALWVDQGTANAGQGYIYPKTASKLYIPITKRAAVGWNESLKYGKDYVLRDRVRGITPRFFIAPVREKVFANFRTEMVRYVRGLVRGGANG